MSKTVLPHPLKVTTALASSLAIGLLLAGAPQVAAEEVAHPDDEAALAPTSSDAGEQPSSPAPADGAVTNATPASSEAPTEAPAASRDANPDSAPTDGQPVETEATSSAPAEVVPDQPTAPVDHVKPKEIKFQTWQELLDWQPGARQDDTINRASVPLAPRYQGHIINPTASPDAKVQALSNMNAKSEDHASVGGEEFKTYAFDHWQYLDSMVFWDGMVPSPDVIDAGHRNGVPVYGTIFFNWSTSQADRDRFMEFIQEDTQGSKTFPLARKIVDLAKYYGYDGYFINQETTGGQLYGQGETMRQFLLYAKQYAQEQQVPLKFSWYDAYDIHGRRNHQNALTEDNRDYLRADQPQGPVPIDEFFANFNWGKWSVDDSVDSARIVGRSPYDVYMGFELQKNSYKTPIPFWDLLDDQGKLRVSLGLFAPDSILGIGTTGERYHVEENNFWTGLQQDPSQPKPEDSNWYGLSGYIADKTAVLGDQFHTSFNTGHGKRWFVDGQVAKDSEWNYRSVAGILPTWRWWLRAQTGQPGLKGGYDFEDAYNGGNSLRFSGHLTGQNTEEAMLYATKLTLTETSQLRLAHKGGVGSTVRVGLATQADYAPESFRYFDLTPGTDWHQDQLDLSSLAGQTIYALKLSFASPADQADYAFNLGQIDLLKDQTAPEAPGQVRVTGQSLTSARQAQAVVAFQPSAQADYYEVYQEVAPDQWQLLTGSSNHHIYLAQVSRPQDATGTTQRLKVVAVGKNGLRSQAGLTTFDWQMTTADTTDPQAEAPNVVPGAVVTFASGPADGSEPADAMLNGTITSNADKWCILDPQGHVDIKLSQVRTIRRWVVDHAGAGGESVNDGLMNTRDFDLYYKDLNTGEWLLAKSIRGNRAHVTDVDLDQPITAQEWRLDVVTAHNGSPWGAIRIYNWKMYEQAASKESRNIPMPAVTAHSLGNGYVQVDLGQVPAKARVRLYADRAATQLLAEVTADQAGPLRFAPVQVAADQSLLYYKTWEDGKEASYLSAVRLSDMAKTIASITLERGLNQTVYHEGDELKLEGGQLRVHFAGEATDQLVGLSHAGVTVAGYDAHRLGAQDLTLTYLGQAISQPLTVFVAKADPTNQKEITHLSWLTPPTSHYRPGQALDLSTGRFQVVYSDQSHQTHTLTDADVTVTGYDADRLGKQTVTLTYLGFTLPWDVWVEKEAANFEYLNQKVAEANRLMPHYRYQFATATEQAAVDQALTAAQALAKAPDQADQAQVDQALIRLTQALAGLSGQAHHDQASLVLKALADLGTDWLARTTDPALHDPLQAQITRSRDLLAQDRVTPADYATAQSALEAALLAVRQASPTVLTDPATGITVSFSGLEPTTITGLAVEQVMPDQWTPAERATLANREAVVYDIEGQDASGQDVDTTYPAQVRVPLPAGRTVAAVLFLPEEGPAQPLAFHLDGDTLVFDGPHFTHYALVLAPATPTEPTEPTTPQPPTGPEQPQGPVTPVPSDTVAAAAALPGRDMRTLPETGETSQPYFLTGLLFSLLGMVGLRRSPKRDNS